MRQSAQDIDLDTLDRNLLKFHYFIAVVRKAVEKKIQDPCGRIIQLIKYSEVTDLIKNFIQRPRKDGNQAATNQLFYVDPHRVIVVYWKEIKQWSLIKHRDTEGYRKFLNFLF